ncbi:MAG: hypothetical protein H0T91_02770 [Propionibacteriaceae bacterium]|nr:hypothetical protein [Propionibacteriaceae bacterium]
MWIVVIVALSGGIASRKPATPQVTTSTTADVPRVEKLQFVITDLLFGSSDGHDDDGTPPHPLEPKSR